MFTALRHRNYRLFWMGNSVSLIGSWMQTMALGWLIYRLTNSPFLLGFIGFANAIPILFITPIGGVIVDRMNKRSVLIVTQTITMLLAFLLAALTLWGHITALQIFLITLLTGAVAAIDAPARQSFIIELVGKDDLMNAIALNSMSFNTARILGPGIAGFVVYWIHESGCFFINALSFLAVLIGLFAINLPPFSMPSHQESFWQNMMTGIRYIQHNKIIKGLLALVAVPSLLTLSYAQLMPVFVRDVYQQDAKAMGILLSSIGVGAVMGALMIAKISHMKRKGKLLISGAISSSVMIILFGLSRNFYLSCFLLILVGFSNVSYLATNNTLIQTNVSDEVRGRVLSLYVLIFLGLMPVGSLLLGAIANWIHVSITITGCAAITLIYTLYMNWKIPELRALT